MLIDAIEDNDGSTDLLYTLLRHVGARTEHTLGYDVGSLDIDKITQMSETIGAIRAGRLGLQYNTQTNMFDIVEQKGQK